METSTQSHFYEELTFSKYMTREYIKILVTKLNRKKEENIIDGERWGFAVNSRIKDIGLD